MAKINVLVTGGAGFIGSHLCKKLLKLDYRVILLDKFNKSPHNWIKQRNILDVKTNTNLSIFDVDVTNSQELAKIFTKQKISYVIHLAGKASVTDSIASPSSTFQVNIGGAVSLFQIATQFRVKHIVYSSSSLVYGKFASQLMKEDDPCFYPTSPYAVSMRSIELLANVYFNSSHIPVTGLRLFPVIGPGMRQNLFFPVIVRAIWENQPVQIFGDGKNVRTYAHIDGVIAGIISSITHPQGCQIINLGGAKPLSLLDLVHLVEKYINKKAKIIFRPQRKEEILYLCPSLKKARKKLGYMPQVKIEEVIKQYIIWWKKEKLNLFDK